MKEYANRLRELRENKGLTRQEAAARSGISFGKLQHYEQGTTDLSTEALVKLADFYGVSADLILGRVNADPDPGDASSMDGAVRDFRELLQEDAATGCDNVPLYRDLVRHLRGAVSSAGELSADLPEDPTNDDLAAYYSKLNRLAADLSFKVQTLLTTEFPSGMIRKTIK